MSKKKFYYAESERLYVEEQMTIEEIAHRLNVSIRTLKSWKQENDWSAKRLKFIGSKRMNLQDFNIFVHNMFPIYRMTLIIKGKLAQEGFTGLTGNLICG